MSTIPTPNDPVTPDGVLLAIREELDAIGVEGAKTFDPALRWNEIDVDSVELVELVAALEEQYGIDMVEEDYDELDTAEALACRISRFAADLTAKRLA